jgi:pentatricopeptide repeat protein
MMMDSMISAAGEFLALVWMELLMCGIAALAYAAFIGRDKLPPASQAQMKNKVDLEDDQPTRELDVVSRDLQHKVSANDHRGVFKIWQRLKSLNGMPHGCLPGIVRCMQHLGKPAAEILAELKSAIECNAAVSDGLVDLLENLQRENGTADETLVSGVTALLEETKHSSASAGVNDAARKRVALLNSALRQSNCEEVLTQLEKVCGETGSMELPAQMMSKLLSFVARDQKSSEILSKVLATGVQFTTKALDDTLREAARRKDAVMLKQLYTMAGAANIDKGPQTYELLMRGFTADRAVVHVLFEEVMSLESIPESLALAVISVCGVTQDSKLLRAVLKQVQSPDATTFPTSSAILAGVVRACVACELYNEACDLYEEKIALQETKPDAQLSGALMKAATQAKRDTLAQTLLEQGAGDLNQHVTMIKACGRKHDLRGAKQAFDRMKQSGAPLSPLIYNCLLDACIQCGDMKGAEEYFSQMKQLECADVVSYNTLLKSYLHSNRSHEAERLLKEMVDRGLPANRVTYNELLNAKVASKDRRGMWKLVDDMKAANVTPNAVSCSILLKALTEHSHEQDVADTLELVKQMDEPMDEVLFSSVIEACIRTRRLDLLSEMMRMYANQGGLFALTAPTYGSMIKAYGQARDVERLWELWNEMRQREVRPTAITLGCMVDALVKNNAVESAWKLLHDLLKDEQMSTLVNTVIYSTVLKGFAMAKQVGKVYEVYAEMRARDVQCNTITYNTMLDACARCSSMDRVSQVLEDMKACAVEPDIITYSTIVKGYCQAGDVDRAFQVLEEMKRDGKFGPDEILYNSLLDGCAKQHRVDEALRLLEDMKASGVAPSNYTLSILVKLMGRARRIDQAFSLIEDLCTTHGFRPNIQVYTCLITACIHNRQVDRALQLHNTMIEEAGCQPDEKLYSVLGRGCLQAGFSQKAAKVVRVAYQLPGHGMAVPKRGGPCGVEARILEEVVSALSSSNQADQEIANQLVVDLKEYRGINAVQNSVYARVAQQAASGSPSRGYRSNRNQWQGSW